MCNVCNAVPLLWGARAPKCIVLSSIVMRCVMHYKANLHSYMEHRRLDIGLATAGRHCSCIALLSMMHAYALIQARACSTAHIACHPVYVAVVVAMQVIAQRLRIAHTARCGTVQQHPFVNTFVWLALHCLRVPMLLLHCSTRERWGVHCSRPSIFDATTACWYSLGLHNVHCTSPLGSIFCL